MDKNRMQIETTRFPHRGVPHREVWGFQGIWSSQVLNNCPVFEVWSIEKYVETSQYVGSPNQTPRDWSFFCLQPSQHNDVSIDKSVKGSEELHGKLLINSLWSTYIYIYIALSLRPWSHPCYRCKHKIFETPPVTPSRKSSRHGILSHPGPADPRPANSCRLERFSIRCNNKDLRKTWTKVSSFIGSMFLHQDLNLSESNKVAEQSNWVHSRLGITTTVVIPVNWMLEKSCSNHNITGPQNLSSLHSITKHFRYLKPRYLLI